MVVIISMEAAKLKYEAQKRNRDLEETQSRIRTEFKLGVTSLQIYLSKLSRQYTALSNQNE
ncbi:hypothetical protein PRIPAC_84224 [Pristionchus pacificus]|uniref:Uncharacterized protein n=1 Tax=Pristionchus pacificus TaxID=54126 RepID=A0A2A6BLX7_PRIPA|nr:hypothetical protein PRIPAC_84224 [Pristionchus pacificus]|eukprot:PDM66806.1 hypothetical protein PRIPAC_48223 [Pristionchus pacificus]